MCTQSRGSWPSFHPKRAVSYRIFLWGWRGKFDNSDRLKGGWTVSCQDNDNTALAPLTNALSQIENALDSIPFADVGFSVNIVIPLLVPCTDCFHSSWWTSWNLWLPSMALLAPPSTAPTRGPSPPLPVLSRWSGSTSSLLSRYPGLSSRHSEILKTPRWRTLWTTSDLLNLWMEELSASGPRIV